MKLILILIAVLNFLAIPLFSMEAPEQPINLDRALIEAVRNGDELQIIEKLLRQGANPNIIDPSQNIPLIWLSQDEEMLKLLLYYGANPHVRYNPDDPNSDSYLTMATLSYPSTYIDLLLNKNNPHPAIVDFQSGIANSTPLIEAAYSLRWAQNNPNEFFNLRNQDPYEGQENLKKIIQKLLDAGADPDKQNSFGDSARSIIPDLINRYTLEKRGRAER